MMTKAYNEPALGRRERATGCQSSQFMVAIVVAPVTSVLVRAPWYAVMTTCGLLHRRCIATAWHSKGSETGTETASQRTCPHTVTDLASVQHAHRVPISVINEAFC